MKEESIGEFARWQAYCDGELSAQEARALEQELAQTPQLQERFASFEAECKRVEALFAPGREEAFEPEAGLARLHGHFAQEAKAGVGWWDWRGWLGTSFAVAVASFVLVLRVWSPVQDPGVGSVDGGVGGQGWTIKGMSVRMLHQYKGRRTSTWTREGTVLRPGDFVQFAYAVHRSLHLMIVSVEDSGKVSRYIPLDVGHSVKLSKGRGTLPKAQAIELDGSLGEECFLVLRAFEAFDFARVKQALKGVWRATKRRQERRRKLASLSVPWRVQQFLCVRKVKTLDKSLR